MDPSHFTGPTSRSRISTFAALCVVVAGLAGCGHTPPREPAPVPPPVPATAPVVQTAATPAVIPAPVAATPPPAPKAEESRDLAEVQVAATRILQPNATSTNPITTIAQEDMQRLGIVNVADAL